MTQALVGRGEHFGFKMRDPSGCCIEGRGVGGKCAEGDRILGVNMEADFVHFQEERY